LELPLEPPPGEPRPTPRRLAGNQPLSGAVVAELSPAFNETLGIDPFIEGIGIVEVEPRSFATRLRLQPGDVVVGINGEPVTSVAALERLLATERRRWIISIERGGQVFDLTIT
jgi:serine protease Do